MAVGLEGGVALPEAVGEAEALALGVAEAFGVPDGFGVWFFLKPVTITTSFAAVLEVLVLTSW